MKNIQMVDLKKQYAAIKEEVDKAISEVIDSTQFIGGPVIQNFQNALEDYLGAKHVIPCANGTDALQIALMSLGLKTGDEVITPSFTFIATTEVIALLGLKPVFVDVDPDSFCIDPDKIEAAISERTKAIVPVHLYGQAANMDRIMQIAQKHGLKVIEDNAQAIGCDYTHADGSISKTGTIGDIGCTSFFPSKNLGCYGDGGAICTNDDELAHQMRKIANHGMEVRYYHDMVGCNSRLDAIQAAVLGVKLPRLDNYCDARRKAADYYDVAFADVPQIKTPYRDPKSKHVFHQYTIQLEGVDRDELNRFLAEKGVPSMIYYPVPAHKQKMFAAFNCEDQELPVTDWLTTRVLSLPMHTELETEELNYICESIKAFLVKS
ncbi:MAG: DegT/DnrJ/EryC1/StrS family aminotransferase [Bacteroidetes bacterium]|nr:MAG: DegT/DnrJ/EryC1/StrS family aminotransferase [Bacteroidota bacterium]